MSALVFIAAASSRPYNRMANNAIVKTVPENVLEEATVSSVCFFLGCCCFVSPPPASPAG